MDWAGGLVLLRPGARAGMPGPFTGTPRSEGMSQRRGDSSDCPSDLLPVYRPVLRSPFPRRHTPMAVHAKLASRSLSLWCISLAIPPE